MGAREQGEKVVSLLTDELNKLENLEKYIGLY